MSTQELQEKTLHPIIDDILASRGIQTPKDRMIFMNPQYEGGVHDPFLFNDMERAVMRINLAIQRGERITIYGDYDVDGLTATVILYETLSHLGACVDVIFNHREHDGYGVCMSTVRTLAKDGTSLIITTDSGITNYDEIATARDLGVDTIVTDHHTVPTDPGRIPPAHAIIHPTVYEDQRYPCRFLSGGGCAFKLSQGLLRRSAYSTEKIKAYEQSFVDLVALSIIADCVPLLDENRVLLRKGLEVLSATPRPGLRELVSRIPSYYRGISVHSLQFTVIPMLNAASRMDHARRAFDLLTAIDSDTAQRYADTLCALNAERQKLSEKTFRQAKKLCKDQLHQNILVASSPDWQLGVLGLVAGKVSRLYDKPVVLISATEERIAGVARSVPSINIVECFSTISHLFKRYGGHHVAGGFALREGVSVEECVDAFSALPVTHDTSGQTKRSTDQRPIPIRLADISWDFVQDLMRCKPWGNANQNPRFVIHDCAILSIKRFGKNDKHSRLLVAQESSRATIIAMSKRNEERTFTPGNHYDIMCEIDCREWFGRPEISLFFIGYTSHE